MINQPRYQAVVAVSIDGKIAEYSGHFSDWTSSEDKSFLHATLDACDVVIVGNTTYQLALEPLKKRNCVVFTRSVFTTERINPGLLYFNPSRVSLADFIKKMRYKIIVILGGTQVYSYCLQNNLIDELYLTVEPIVFGSGLPLFDAGHQCAWKLETIKRLNNKGAVLLKYLRT